MEQRGNGKGEEHLNKRGDQEGEWARDGEGEMDTEDITIDDESKEAQKPSLSSILAEEGSDLDEEVKEGVVVDGKEIGERREDMVAESDKVDNIKAKDKKHEEMQLAKEREKELMEETGSEDEEIQELKQSVKNWKKNSAFRKKIGPAMKKWSDQCAWYPQKWGVAYQHATRSNWSYIFPANADS